MSPAHRGATALVPPITVFVPSIRTSYPVSGSALPDTSGTPRIDSAVDWPLLLTALRSACQLGVAKKLLTPPPLAPPLVPSFQTTSLEMLLPLNCRLVPPQPSANGLEAG